MAISMQFFSKPYSGQSNQDILDTLEDILTELQGIATDTDDLETQLSILISKTETGNISLVNIKNVLDSILLNLGNIDANTDGLEALLTSTNTKLQSLIDTQDKELIVWGPVIGCDGMDKYYVRGKIIFDSETNVLIDEVIEYSEDLITWVLNDGDDFISGFEPCEEKPTEYNCIEVAVVDNNNSYTYYGGSCHSLSIAVLNGTGTIKVGDVTYNVSTGYSTAFEATNYIGDYIKVTGTDASSYIVVTCMKYCIGPG